MKALHLSLMSALCLLLSACAGSNFVKPTDDKLVLGQTTRSQVVAMMGEPLIKGQKTLNGEQLDILTYAYATFGATPVFEGVTPARSIGFIFHRDLLAGREYVSSFKEDNTYFDPQKAKSIKQGMSGTEVLTIMGKPGGEYGYPVIANKNGKGLAYLFTQTKGFTSQQSKLVVELDEKGVVEKVDFTQIGQ